MANSLPQRDLLAGIRETNACATIGVQTIKISPDAGVSRDQVAAFLTWLGELVREKGAYDVPLQLEEIADVNASAVRWCRLRYHLYPLYLDTLEISPVPDDRDSSLPPGVEVLRRNFWRVSPSVFEDGTQAYSRHRERWRDFVIALVEHEDVRGGFAFNVLEIPGESLQAGKVDVRPLVLHALGADGSPCDRGNVRAQAAVANAFWQTFWATGALRTQRGRTFPVAFVPIDRTWVGEFLEPWHSRWIALRRRLFGRSSLMGYMCEALTAKKALWFDLETLSFKMTSDFDPKAFGLEPRDFLLCLYELNRTGFVDAYTGENANLFSNWKEQERLTPGSSRPWSWELAREALNAGERYLAKDPDKAPRRFVRIRRVVPYGGCAFLSEVVNQTGDLLQRGKIQDFSDTIVGATNSTFFLNFPEEYATLHSAMNDPVSALVENGYCHQIKTLRRAALVIPDNGLPLITTKLSVKLENPALAFEGESVAATYFDKAHRPFTENKVGPVHFGAVIVGNSVVETFEDMTAEVPANGWVIGDSEAFDHNIEPRAVATVELRDEKTGAPVAIRHALAVGPLLVSEGEVVALGESKEEFAPILTTETPDFDEGAELPRTQLPRALREAPQRGVPPTRFPYDWNITRAPRTAIGVRKDGTVIVVVVDGRACLPHSIGATLAELAQLMRNLGCWQAMNMDGGGSSVMFVNDPRARDRKLSPDLQPGVVNLPSDLGGVERLLPVALVVTRRVAKNR